MKAALVVIFLLAPLASAGPILHSNVLAPNVIYLNCDASPWDATDDVIEQVWQLVVDAFPPSLFKVDVTTGFPGYRTNVAQVVIGGQFENGYAGISPVGTWTTGTLLDQFTGEHTAAAYVYADGYANSILPVAKAVIHELGHNIGLIHQPDGFMYTYVDPDPATFRWTVSAYQDDVAVLGGAMGFAPVPEPPVLLAACGMVLMRRGRR